MGNNVIETNKNKNLIIVVMACVIVLLIAALVYFLFIKKDKPEEQVKPQDIHETEDIKKNNTFGLKDVDGNDISLDYEKLEQDLINKVKSGSVKIELQHCENCEDFDYDNADSVKCTKKELGVNSITVFISKLKSANSVEYLPTGRECSEYVYSVGNEFFGFEADDSSILLMGINNNGYAFHFDNENMIEFLSNLT